MQGWRLLIVAALSLALFPAFKGLRFVNVIESTPMNISFYCGDSSKNYIVEVNGNGCVWFDYNNDGFLDLYLTQGSTIDAQLGREKTGYHNYLFANQGNGRFLDMTEQAGVAGRLEGWAMGAIAGDYDKDGWTDLLVTYIGRNLFYRNNGDGTFTDVTQKAGLWDAVSWHAGASFGDYDGDGYLDLYVSGYVDFDFNNLPGTECPYQGLSVMCGPAGLKGAPDFLYRNRGDGTFEDVTEEAGIVDSELQYGFAVAFVDLDGDTDLDLYVANDSRPNFLYRNDADGTFAAMGMESGTALREDGREQAGMGVAIGDYDRDGRPDIFVTNFSDDYNTLYRNEGDLLFGDVTRLIGLAETSLSYLGWAAFYGDFDLDGWEDLFVANGHVYPEVDFLEVSGRYAQRNFLYLNVQGQAFEEVGELAGLRLEKVSRGGASADFDNDGDLDIFVLTMDGKPSLLENRSETGNNWVGISFPQPFGAVIKLSTASGVQYRYPVSGGSYLSQNDPRVLFGVGKDTAVLELEITWPGGKRRVYKDIQINRYNEVKGPGL